MTNIWSRQPPPLSLSLSHFYIVFNFGKQILNKNIYINMQGQFCILKNPVQLFVAYFYLDKRPL